MNKSIMKNDSEIYNKKHKVYAVIRDSQGYTIECVLIDPSKDKFSWKRREGEKGDIYFTKGIEESSYFTVYRGIRGNKKEFYVPYNVDYPLPLSFKTNYIRQDENGGSIDLFPTPSMLTPIYLDQKARILNQDDMKENLLAESLGNMIKSKLFWILAVLGIGIMIAIQEFGVGA